MTSRPRDSGPSSRGHPAGSSAATDPKSSHRAASGTASSSENLTDAERVQRVRAITGVALEERAILEALTHRAYCNDHPDDDTPNYERLEFLGDAVLDLVAAEILLTSHPNADEGELTRRRAAYVSEPALAKAAAKTGLDALVRLSRAQTQVGDNRLPSICADVVEAIIAVSFNAGGLDLAREVCATLLGAPAATLEAQKSDAKTTLQERIQALLGEVPRYSAKRADGPDHAPVFVATVFVGEHALGTSQGKSKKIATTAAAEVANEAVRNLDDAALRARLKS